MSVILVTGQPGSGKTAHVVDLLAHDDQFKGRTIYTMGIPDLTLATIPCPPVEQWTEFRKSPEDETLDLAYFTFPENSLVVIDEAQRVYRPRPVGSKVPPEVAAFETHRHLGIDFILITQHAGLIDSNIRKLVGRHIHIRVTALGRYRYEWTELGDPESHSSRELAAREKYKLPIRVFDLYKSSQLHTKIKPKIPVFVWVFVVATIVAIALGGFAAYRVKSRIDGETVKSPEAMPQHAVMKSDAMQEKIVTQESLLLERVPRIQGELHTAPRYDQLTQPVRAPELRGCVATPKRCECTDQDGGIYPLSVASCRQYVQHGLPFRDWIEPPKETSPSTSTPHPAPPPSRQPPAQEAGYSEQPTAAGGRVGG